MYTVTIEQTGESFPCDAEQTILKGMERLGYKGIPVGCRGGGCGVCKIQIVCGEYQSKKMNRDHISEADEAEGIVLACRVLPSSDVRIRVSGTIQKKINC